jgi:S-adenosylmethionine synthetase
MESGSRENPCDDRPLSGDVVGRGIRHPAVLDDQNIVIGYACGDERTNYLPVAHWVSGELGRRLFARLRRDANLSATFGPDFKILASLEAAPGENRVHWRHLILSVQHIPKLPYERQHRVLLPILEQILGELEAGGLVGAAAGFAPDKLILNGAGEFAIGGPEGDNGLSGKKLVVDHYGPSAPIGGGALPGKDPHKVDKCGALRARQLAKKLVRDGVDEARVTLGWAPGGDAPFLTERRQTREVLTCRCRELSCPRKNGSQSSRSSATWNSMNAIGLLICWQVISVSRGLLGSAERI